ncbi:hypothetical protein BT63DRAFT_69784 [Microthyrium microscopicum]|uniref:S-adenosyl-L-methionine-dependent methyltransferase n=1 Tax=Microthyrium microscopicum TaxID=703497 RepID=A0A6A6TZV0_9PEZI|nr:hypothetical protein BT63DRAFT_69784 [Microthyrium microscopicum]
MAEATKISDSQSWEEWHQKELPGTFKQLFPPSGKRATDLKPVFSILEYVHPRLKYKFSQNAFARLRLRPPFASEYACVVKIHNIVKTEGAIDSETAWSLVITKYSFLHSRYPFRSMEQKDSKIKLQELVLHFDRADVMGSVNDAETICFADIVGVGGLSEKLTERGVEHVVQVPDSDDTYFCRFAVQYANQDEVACYLPLKSSLLSKQAGTKRHKFPSPTKTAIMDLSPRVLGLAEGFAQAGHQIHSAVGFDPSQHMTWMCRHGRNSSTQVFDGHTREVLEDIATGQFGSVPSRTEGHFLTAVIAGENTTYRIQKNSPLPSVERFCRPLEKIESVLATSLGPDFIVLLISPAVLRSKAADKFAATLLRLLDLRYSVHMRLAHLPDHGIPQARKILLLVASALPGPLPWHIDWPSTTQQRKEITVEQVLDGLPRSNTRTSLSPNSITGFACPIASQELGSKPSISQQVLYNHQLGHSISKAQPIDLNSKAVGLSCDTSYHHPLRGDALTVRELARLQGLEDNLVFYHSLSSQYIDVNNAIPPILTRRIGHVLLQFIHDHRIIERQKAIEDEKNRRQAERMDLD